MTREVKVVKSHDDCPFCGADVEIHTSAAQPKDAGWNANQGDMVTCPDCNVVGVVRADADPDGAYISFTEPCRMAVPSGDDCPICGTEWDIHTSAVQPPGGNWWALDDDPVICPECGALGAVHADPDGAHIAFDEDLPHNVALYDARCGERSSR